MIVRHGFMVVGEPFSGKSCALNVLKDALGDMESLDQGERAVITITINPKSVTNLELYGFTDIATNEWSDGVLPVKFKKLAQDEAPQRKWLMFDGPVDAVWIEDMNTVLDDNKKLCLSNGDIYYMSPTMNMIFEPMDLLDASPATVSRCGMVYMEPHMMGWTPIYESWKIDLPSTFHDYDIEAMDIYFSNILTPLLLNFDKGQFEFTAPSYCQNIVKTLLKLANKFMKQFEEKVFYNSFEFKDRVALVDQIMVYCTCWSAGATVTSDGRRKFDSSLKRFINSADSTVSEETARKHRKIKLPDGGTIFDYYLEIEEEEIIGDDEKRKIKIEWQKWTNLIDVSEEIDPESYVNEIVIKTADTIRYSHLMREAIKNEYHIFVVGPTGTGKTVYIKRILKELDTNKY